MDGVPHADAGSDELSQNLSLTQSWCWTRKEMAQDYVPGTSVDNRQSALAPESRHAGLAVRFQNADEQCALGPRRLASNYLTMLFGRDLRLYDM